MIDGRSRNRRDSGAAGPSTVISKTQDATICSFEGFHVSLQEGKSEGGRGGCLSAASSPYHGA